ncbi:hypothetical protein VTI74DRAFT_903 [Chaetomium olivicolor]
MKLSGGWERVHPNGSPAVLDDGIGKRLLIPVAMSRPGEPTMAPRPFPGRAAPGAALIPSSPACQMLPGRDETPLLALLVTVLDDGEWAALFPCPGPGFGHSEERVDGWPWEPEAVCPHAPNTRSISCFSFPSSGLRACSVCYTSFFMAVFLPLSPSCNLPISQLPPSTTRFRANRRAARRLSALLPSRLTNQARRH